MKLYEKVKRLKFYENKKDSNIIKIKESKYHKK